MLAISDWLDGAAVDDLHERFAFVDRCRRGLLALAAEAGRLEPDVGRLAPPELRQSCGDSFELWHTAGDRSCELHYYGDNKHPDATFHWDQCYMFRFDADDPARFAAVLKRWLCDRATPSQMRASFPSIDLSPVAAYYEAGRAVEGEFIVSWGGIQRLFAEYLLPGRADVLAFIAALRRAGYDHTLRAGQSMFSFVLSRSRRHGMRPEQPCVAINFGKGDLVVHANMGGRRQLRVFTIDITPEVTALLERAGG